MNLFSIPKVTTRSFICKELLELGIVFIDDFHKRRNVQFNITDSVVGAFRDTGNYFIDKSCGRDPKIMKQVFISPNDRITFL